MQRRICPICDHPIKYGHYCSFCKQWIRNPNYVNATYYLNERHPAHETDCEYHNAGSASWETSARAGTDAIRTLADRAKAYSQTQKAAGAGRQASVRTQNQNSMSYQTTQRRSAVQQRLVAARQTHHRLIDGGVAVRVQLHRLADDVGGFGAGLCEKPHFVHGVQKLAVRRLEAVNLRNGTRDDDRHGVGHIVGLQRLTDRLLEHLRPQPHHIRVVMLFAFRLFFLWHS